jgi:hypothetical protein
MLNKKVLFGLLNLVIMTQLSAITIVNLTGTAQTFEYRTGKHTTVAVKLNHGEAVTALREENPSIAKTNTIRSLVGIQAKTTSNDWIIFNEKIAKTYASQKAAPLNTRTLRALDFVNPMMKFQLQRGHNPTKNNKK